MHRRTSHRLDRSTGRPLLVLAGNSDDLEPDAPTYPSDWRLPAVVARLVVLCCLACSMYAVNNSWNYLQPGSNTPFGVPALKITPHSVCFLPHRTHSDSTTTLDNKGDRLHQENGVQQADFHRPSYDQQNPRADPVRCWHIFPWWATNSDDAKERRVAVFSYCLFVIVMLGSTVCTLSALIYNM